MIEIENLCTNCNYCVELNNQDVIDIDKLSDSICSCCSLVIKSSNSQKANNSLSKRNFNLVKQSVYFHSNESILNNVPKETQDVFKNKNILLVGTGSIKRLPILKSIKSLKSNKLICLSRQKNWANNYVDGWILAEHENIAHVEDTLKKIENYSSENSIRFDAIFTYDDYCVLTASFLANKFNLPSIPFKLAAKIKNKYEFRNYCKNLNIKCPKFFLIKSQDRQNYLNSYADSKINKAKSPDCETLINFPIIIKNPTGAGKDFIQKCDSVKDYLDCIKKSLQYFSYMDLLIEEFYQGHEIDIEILIQNNKIKFFAISDNFPANEPCFFEQGGLCPSVELSKKEKSEIERIVTKWLNKMNFQNACLHFEARCRPESLFTTTKLDENNNVYDEQDFLMPIEINLRLGGAETWSMIKTSFDVDLIQEYLKISADIRIDEDCLKQKRLNPKFQCISKDFHPSKTAIINSIIVDLEKIRQDENVVEISIFRSPKDSLTIKDYIGWITAKIEFDSCSLKKLYSNINNALNSIKFVFKDYH